MKRVRDDLQGDKEPAHPHPRKRLLTLDAKQRFQEMRATEKSFQPASDYLQSQKKLELWMREMVVQFINEMGEDFGIQNDTVGLAINYFDRFLSAIPVVKTQIQSLSVGCLLVASKFNECRTPCMEDLMHLCNHQFTREDIKRVELNLLHGLKWELHAHTPHHFLSELLTCIGRQKDVALTKHSEFFVDLSYYEYQVLRYSPCIVAAAALLCGLDNVGDIGGQSIPFLCQMCDTSPSELLSCKDVLNQYFTTFLSNNNSNPADFGQDPRELQRETDSPTGVCDADFRPIA